MSIARIMNKIIRTLPMLEGASGKMTISAKQLQQMAAGDQKAKRVVQELMTRTQNPTLDVAYKAKSNYAIAGIRLKDGKKVIGNGAVSITHPGSSKAVVKYRASVDGGRTLGANGFIDGGQYANMADSAISISRKGGMVTYDAAVGKAAAEHFTVNEQAAKDFLHLAPNGDHAILQYDRGLAKIQQGLDKAMSRYRDTVRGQLPEPNFKLKKVFNAPETFTKKTLSSNDFKKVFEKGFKVNDKIKDITPSWLEELKKINPDKYNT